MKHLLAALLSGLILAGPAVAEPMEDVDYVLIEPQPVASGDRIEVIEFFYYGCESCNRFEPLLAGWLKSAPSDVSFRRVPALRRMDWAPLARLYFALEESGELERLHADVYAAIHDRKSNLGTAKDLMRWARKNGLDWARFDKLINSESVAIKVQKARDTTIAYGIRATPSLVVDGKYLTTGGMIGSVEGLLPVLDGLLATAREARAGK